MALSLRELVVVLVIALVVFACAKRSSLLFSTREDFARRRNLWLFITTAVFLSPTFWIFVAISLPVLIWAGSVDRNPAAVYMLLLSAIPPAAFRLPMVGLSYLIELSGFTLLALGLMLPTAIRILRSKAKPKTPALRAMDLCILSYGLLTAFLYVRPEASHGVLVKVTTSNNLRSAAEFLLDIYVPYFVISRTTITRQALMESWSMFCLSAVELAAVAIFENRRHWLLYANIPGQWGSPGAFTSYLTSGSQLRAMASTGHPLALGNLLVVALGMWLYLERHVQSRLVRASTTGILVLGLIVTFARGNWLGAVLLVIAFAAFRPKALSRLLKIACIAAAGALLAAAVPVLRELLVAHLPFLGGRTDVADLVYRERLLDRVLQIAKAHPLFGDQSALLQMQDLRQGQGIIDIANTYLGILLGSGLVGLSLFLSFILIGLRKVRTLSRKLSKSDPDFSTMGAALIASIIALLFVLADGSFADGPARMFFALGAFSVSYAQVGETVVHRALVNSKRELTRRSAIVGS